MRPPPFLLAIVPVEAVDHFVKPTEIVAMFLTADVCYRAALWTVYWFASFGLELLAFWSILKPPLGFHE